MFLIIKYIIMKKPKISTLVAVTALALGITTAGVGVMHAAGTNSANNPMSNLVNAIAQKFNLNTADVQQVFDQQKQQMQAQRQQAEKDRLAQAVTDGKLTQDQADKITAKQQELQAQRQADKTALQGKTPAERQAARKSEMDSLKQWAADNNIPLQYVQFGFGGPSGHRGHGLGGFGQGQAPQSNSVTAPAQTN